MDFDKKYGFSFLDGIPFKIASSFIPPPPVVLPNISNLDEQSFFDKVQYDFSFEKEVLEDIKEKQETNKKLFPPKLNVNKCNKIENNQNGSFNVQNVPSMQSEILLPEPNKIINKTSKTNSDSNSKINLSDFENDTSSPFDYMELQTINDFEELSNVFQGLNNKYNSEDNVCKDKVSISSSCTDEDKVTNSFCKSISFPLQNNEGLDNSEKYLACSKESTLRGFATWNPCSTSSPINIENDHITKNSAEDFSRTLNLSLPKVPSFENNDTKDPTELEPKLILRGWKSSSDLCNLTEQTSESIPKQERSCTPPAHMFSEVKASTPCEGSKVPSSNTNCDNSSHFSGFPDPYDELSEDARKFVDAITDMGFPRGQVSRMVRHLGIDEKEVVEHLCQIQTLQESGYDCFEAEAALHLHDYNQNQAKQFLDMINKFQDLGFEKNAVKKALIQNKNDLSKTIDALLS